MGNQGEGALVGRAAGDGKCERISKMTLGVWNVTRIGGDFNVVGLALQYRWGGGL